MTGCVSPTLTREDVAALGDIERATARVQSAVTSAILTAGAYRAWHTASDRCRPRMLTHGKGRHIPNRARHVPRTLLNNLSMFADAYWRETLSQGQTHLMLSASERSFGADRRISSSLRPRRVTIDGLAIVRGRR